jgi:hypothetical protein
MSEQMRAEFEEWVKSRCGDAMKREGEYVSSMTREWFKSWQASRQALVVELPPSIIDEYSDGSTLTYVELHMVINELDKAGVAYK